VNIASGVPGLHLVCLTHGPEQTRTDARAQIRLALQNMVAEQLNVNVERVAITSTPGEAPQLLLDAMPHAGGISLAHDGNKSIAAWYAHGAVGIDIMQVQDTPDWRQVAGDYLGPGVLAELGNAPDAERPRAFARAWTQREACLKYLGQPLSEWTALPEICSFHRLDFAADYAATVAIKKGHDLA
jgi:4'-phosphopantetheinyl transferase